MGKAGQALKQVLTSYDISQSQLATELGVERPIVFRWFHEQTDPTAETVAEIVRAIQIIDPEASREFVELYLGHLTTNAPMNLIRLDSGQLPESDQVDVVALSRLFSNTTTSYKYLFFLSLLVLSHQKWLKAVEFHISELKMSDAEDLLDIEKLRKAYELTINPLMSLATIQGFSPDWSYH
ncbi:helix-turn-helix domain-containing protein [Coleofasciculus sp.]|uniref:helix-turn-helix domain-containing protein n=1 Tax=Coleofasciculus sp. TaxID=3100458 RepID=UPI0039FAFD55